MNHQEQVGFLFKFLLPTPNNAMVKDAEDKPLNVNIALPERSIVRVQTD